MESYWTTVSPTTTAAKRPGPSAPAHAAAAMIFGLLVRNLLLRSTPASSYGTRAGATGVTCVG